ncbi:MAG TPA: PEP-CTERM sorting domain-containing protein [Lacipirellulaceae bacterium]|jgi:hypothetical protein|nr:PEP-CTERM sorting domain-containing protein [Lacipirellulaceae bacterium]
MKRYVWLTIFGLASAAPAWAVPTMDGSVTAGDGYGTALSVQNTNTQFGNAGAGDQVHAGGGSEIDQVYGTVQNGRLYVTVTGNLEDNFNKLEVFVDSKAGGVNTINGSALPAGVDAYCCGGPGTTDGALQRLNGLTFDSAFSADYYLSFTNGQENVTPPGGSSLGFWAISAHYADLTQGTNGAVVAAGYQVAPQGKPNVLRFPGDYNHNGATDAADYVMWRHAMGQTVPHGTGLDGNNNGVIDSGDYDIWRAHFGGTTTLADSPWYPNDPTQGASGTLTGPALPGLAQGQLIDRNYATTSGGCNTDNSGNGCAAAEVGFALNVDPNDVGNTKNHRNFNNTVGLEMAFDNSNTAGVTGDSPYGTATTGDPQNVNTGLEFSIPLSQIGATAGSGPIKLAVFVNNGSHDYISNQFGGDGLLFGNYGALPMNLDLDFPGNQYVSVANSGAGSGAQLAAVPEPASFLLMVVGGLVCGALRRR